MKNKSLSEKFEIALSQMKTGRGDYVINAAKYYFERMDEWTGTAEAAEEIGIKQNRLSSTLLHLHQKCGFIFLIKVNERKLIAIDKNRKNERLYIVSKIEKQKKAKKRKLKMQKMKKEKNYCVELLLAKTPKSLKTVLYAQW